MKFKGYTKSQLLNIYETMFLSRELDRRQLLLLKQGKGFFHIGASGHEAAEVAAAMTFDTSRDYFYPYYRDQAFCLGLGMTAKEMLLSFLAKEEDPNSGGRQMPQHFGHKMLNIVSQSSPTGTQYLQAVGASFILKNSKDKGVVYVSSGEGTTSQGDFHEALNWASREKAPVIFHIENNGYAISVPIEDQTSGASVYQITSGYENLSRYNIDGCDFFESTKAFKLGVDRARKGKGPTVIVSNLVRLLPHSSSDDHSKYRTEKELKDDVKRDPLEIFKKQCVGAKIIKSDEFSKINENINLKLEKDLEFSMASNPPSKNTVFDHLYSKNTGIDELVSKETKLTDTKVVMVDAINHALEEEMINNKKMIIFGQDIAGGKGGVFTATRELTKKFGQNRVFNSPLAESSIIGTAIGMATLGHKPVVEIQFGDYIWTSMMQIRNELATLRYRSNGNWSCPVVIRVPVGGYIHGSLCHSQSIDAFFTHIPGIKIAFPSNASDAKGLLKSACRMNDPVIFMEHKFLYRQNYSSSIEPDKDYYLEYGVGSKINSGNDLTVVSWGATIHKCVDAISNTNVSADLIDLRTLCPIDFEIIEESIKKTGRLIVVHEDNITNGFGSEIVSRVTEKCFELLDAPVLRVASEDVPIAYSSILEEEILVQTSWIEKAIYETINY